MIRGLKIFAFVAAMLHASLARANDDPQQLDTLIEEALDQTVKHIDVADQPIPDALGVIERETGVRFVLDPRVLELMPYGPRTRVSLSIDNIPLRTGLRQMVDRLALDWRIEKDSVRIEPSPALRRLGRRISVAELQVVEKLAAGPLNTGAISIQYIIDPARKPSELLEQAIKQVGDGPATRQLESATAALGWVWMPREDQIVVCPRRDYYRSRFETAVDIDYQRKPLDELMIDLGRRADVPIAFEPGVLARMSASKRCVDLLQRETSPRQAFELICGRTGLSYELGDDGVRVSAPASTSSSAVQPAGPMSVRLTFPVGNTGAMVEFLIPEDQLPAELRSLRAEKIQELLTLLRQQESAAATKP